MELKGKIIAVLPIQQGTSKSGSQWRSMDFVIETQESFPKKVCFTILGKNLDNLAPSVVAGADATVSFDISSREYNGRWFTSAVAWKIASLQAPQPPTPPQAQDIVPF